MNKSLSVGEILKFSWKAFKDNALVLILLTLMTFVVQLLLAIPSCGHEELMKQMEVHTAGFNCGLYQLLMYIANIFITMGFATVAAIAARGEKVQFSQFFSQFGKFFHFIVASILYSIIVFVGLLLLIFPGIIWAIKYSLYPFMVVEKGAFGWTALKLSSQATYGAKWDLLGLYAAIILIFALAFIPFGLGLFIAIPLTWIAQAFAWKKLTDVGG